MNKKNLLSIIFSIIFVFAIILIGFLTYIIWFQKPQPIQPIIAEPEITSYDIAITEHNGDVGAVITKGKNTSELAKNDIPKYAIISFNGPRDIMWAECANGFKLIDASSPSKNSLVRDPILGVNITVVPDTLNVLKITCTKK
jgi:Flp pilus assembly protein CpaB